MKKIILSVLGLMLMVSLVSASCSYPSACNQDLSKSNSLDYSSQRNMNNQVQDLQDNNGYTGYSHGGLTIFDGDQYIIAGGKVWSYGVKKGRYFSFERQDYIYYDVGVYRRIR